MSAVGKTFTRALVLGATGGIGAGFVRALVVSGTEVWAGSRQRAELPGARWLPFDIDDEATLAAAADRLRATPPDLVLVASGVLTLADGTGPERSLRQIDAAAMAEVLRINTIGPALAAKHFLPLLPRDGRSVFAALGARVGSIGDNRLGGWHSYRASKAALAMLMRNFAIEMARTKPHAVVVALHPGTVDSALSRPFQANLPAGQLLDPDSAAMAMLGVLGGLKPQDSGGFFDWKGERVPA